MTTTAIRQGGPKREFDLVLDFVKMLHRRLMEMEPISSADLRDCNYACVYVFSEAEEHLYVGRSRRVRERILQHSRPSSQDAPFAFRLAREKAGMMKPSYQKIGSRQYLRTHPQFKAAFLEAKERIRKMKVRCVHVDDATTQALLEIYTSTVLDARYNEFKTT